MIPVYPWPFHPEYYRRRQVLDDRRRRLNAMGKPVYPDSSAATACKSLAQIIDPNPFAAGHLLQNDIGADVLMPNLPADEPPLRAAPVEGMAAINAMTLQATIPNAWQAQYLYNPAGTYTEAPEGHFTAAGKFVALRFALESGTFFTSPPYVNFRGLDFGGIGYYSAGRNTGSGAVGEIGGQEGRAFTRWTGLRPDGTMVGAGESIAYGEHLSNDVTGYYYIRGDFYTPAFADFAASHGKGVKTYADSPFDAVDVNSAACLSGYSYPMAWPTDGDGWIFADRKLRHGFDQWQVYLATQYRTPSPIMPGAVIQNTDFPIAGNDYVLTEAGTLYRYDGQAMSARATGVYLFGASPARIYFDNGTEEEL